jgi:hypothetical protein
MFHVLYVCVVIRLLKGQVNEILLFIFLRTFSSTLLFWRGVDFCFKDLRKIYTSEMSSFASNIYFIKNFTSGKSMQKYCRRQMDMNYELYLIKTGSLYEIICR